PEGRGSHSRQLPPRPRRQPRWELCVCGRGRRPASGHIIIGATIMKRLVLALCLYVATLQGVAAATTQEREQAFRKLPDWTGIWIADDGIMTRLGLRNDVEGDSGPTFGDRIMSRPAPYNPEWRAKAQAALKSTSRYRQTGKECGFYFPGVMESPW